MGVVVTFNYPAWLALYPQFTPATPYVGVTEPIGQNYFNIATGFWRNDGTGPCTTVEKQTTLLYLLTAHIALLFSGTAAAAPSGLVGRISSASEGSVSVSTEFKSNSEAAAYFNQTQFGALYWLMTAGYRTFRYRANPQVVTNGLYPYRPFGY